MKTIVLASGEETIINDDDARLVCQWRWQVQKAGPIRYARRTGPSGTIYMHRLIAQPPPGMVVDHIDGNGLNNQRSNLRVLTFGQNLWNRRDRATGVSWRRPRNGWRATIDHEGRKYEVGLYLDQKMAVSARAYVASILRDGIAPVAAEIDRLELSPSIRRLIHSLSSPTPPSSPDEPRG
ncbi:MAG: Stahl75 [Xanthobacteraceae bacterium]|nr:Stahl75 [Xanthobacteraceae bacterium]